MKAIFTTILFSLFAFSALTAQKYGHLNSNEIISSFPEVKSADSDLESYSSQLIEKGKAMMTEYQESYQTYVGRANSGELSQLQMQQEEAKLTQKQQEIQKYEVEVQDMIAKKKQEVYQPILDKIQAVIDQIGKEQGFTMIFDSSSLGMIFAADSEDLMPVVKQRLGM